MLMLASIVGVACFVYSLLTMDSYQPSQEICTNSSYVIKMCPLCDHFCDYWDLTCMQVKTKYLFDNPTTVFFAIFMSFWGKKINFYKTIMCSVLIPFFFLFSTLNAAALFLELWKRYSAEITHRWDLTGFDIYEEHPRPQYLARLAHVKKVRIDYVTMVIVYLNNVFLIIQCILGACDHILFCFPCTFILLNNSNNLSY